ncbi:MAG: hypothetical protein KF780_06915 [Sphingomonas sp.]|nr:hypothetical protein [Sphingomonas sp.]
MTDAGFQNRIDPATIDLPNLDFTPDPDIESNYDKYYYFHRADADFDTAYMDILECDGYARGLTHRVPYQPVPYAYAGTIGGAIGGAIGNALADAIYGSAERRRQRRYNMRTCMGFKGYRIYGLSKPLWEAFNFEEGNRRIDEGERLRLLQIQARVASGPTPRQGEIVE